MRIIVRPLPDRTDKATIGRTLAEEVSAIVDPHSVRTDEEHNRPPFVKDSPDRFQLDRSNDWTMHEHEPGIYYINHRYSSPERMLAVALALAAFGPRVWTVGFQDTRGKVNSADDLLKLALDAVKA